MIHNIQGKGLTRMHAKLVEIKADGTGRYRYNVAAWTAEGKIYGLLDGNEVAGLAPGVYPGDVEIEVFETSLGTKLLHKIVSYV